jgi:uncharacterized membrane protein YqhA
MASLWFNIFMFIVSLFIIAVAIANIVYFTRIKQDTSQNIISSIAANNLIFVNVLLLILSLVMFVWGIYHLFLSKKQKESLKSTLTSKSSLVELPKK